MLGLGLRFVGTLPVRSGLNRATLLTDRFLFAGSGKERAGSDEGFGRRAPSSSKSIVASVSFALVERFDARLDIFRRVP